MVEDLPQLNGGEKAAGVRSEAEEAAACTMVRRRIFPRSWPGCGGESTRCRGA
jgi:hypothetical protein